ncbi:MAG TPA: Hint domain-containing protein, partial [Rhodopila sp.]|nr:Hint domain-containing protein [Rhodopila sp.]
EFGNTTSATVAFAGSGVTVALDSPSQFHGTVAGFEAGDTLLLKGISATSVKIVHSDTLALIANGVTVDKLVLAGNYTGASFQAVSAGGSTTVTNLSGAPRRDGIGIETIAVTNTIGLSNSLVAAIENDLSFAVSEWGQYITGAAPLRISLSFINSGQFGSELAEGSPGGFIATGQTVDGHAIFIPDSVYALETGDYASGFSTDIAITVVASTANLANFYVNSNPSAATTVPLGKFDLVSVLEHEVGHGLGFTGLINRFAPVAGSPPIFTGAEADPYDMLVSYGTVGATFDGANAEAAYGAMINAGSPTPVPLYLATNSSLDTENFYHVASIAALSGDVMNVAMPAGTFLPVSALDLAILKDTGVPVTSSVNCFVRGTRVLTDCGYISIETLRAGDVVVTHDGSAQPIVWIGCRTIDCRHHPTPDRVYPVRIAAHAFGENLPERPLLVSPEHAVYFDDVLIPVRLLEDGVLVRRVPCSTVEYYHLELACHDIVFAEGLPAETYLDCGDRGNFANSDGAVRLFPDFAVFPPSDVWEARGCAPLCLTGPSLAAARALLRRRGEGRGGSWFERVNQA